MSELPLTMPKMSMTMEEGTMVAWLKQEGDSVRSGEPICEVATDKVDMEVESPFDGVLARIIGQPDEVFAVGDTIAFITTEADDLLGGLFDEPAIDAPAAAPAAAEVAPAAVPAPIATGWIPAVPAARGAADAAGINIATVTPTGPDNTVRLADVEAAVAGTSTALAAAAPIGAPVAPVVPATPAPVAAPAAAAAPVAAPAVAQAAPAAPAAPAAAVDPVEARRLRTRKQVAKVMSASALVPQFTAYVDLDLSALAAVRKTTLGGASWTALFVRAQAIALAENAALNGTWTDGGVAANEHIGIALAIDSPSGLIAPVLTNSHEGTLAELVAEIATVVDETRNGTLPPARLGGGTSVFSNLGGFGVESFNALLTPPQSTALSSGAVKPRMRVFADGTFGVRLSCTIGLTVDHRVADGADAARMLATITNLVATPERLL
ncbi:dihydrolipoamide acetyltransferase family protein [Salinibacterium sp. SWN248]|uniref:dihydrolipoamide acetyltransferase family protein n=1 Tax=Salinibacterium sp. SWN248 TaxID=2792056 RepID=UPI0018CE10EB|nr:dihydrolipoamide acetyltransferase family protein [Salinibacterium sp. SWN248]MBH0023431.1 2-oxo acid dehydrogenase subunit E2 [Salinibacterium sp. SWN248]